MYQQSFYKLNEDISDTLSKLIPGEKILSYLKLQNEDSLDESDQLDLVYYIHQLYTSGKTNLTLVNNSDDDSPFFSIEEDGGYDYYYYILRNKAGEIFARLSCSKDFDHMEEEPILDLSKFTSLSGVNFDLEVVLSNIDDSVESQSFLESLSAALMNNQYDKNNLINILNDFRNTNNAQIKEIFTTINYLNDEDITNPSAWLSIFVDIYNSMNSCEYNDGVIEFNTINYEPMFSWRTVFSGAISTLSTVVMAVGGAIGAVVGLIGHLAGSLINTVWDESAEMKIDFKSEDVCFAQPLGFAKKSSVNGFAWGTNTVENKIVQVCSPVFKRFLWYQDSILFGECYARISFTPDQIRTILGEDMWGILYSDDSIHSYDSNNFSYQQICDLYNTVDASGYRNASEYLSDPNISNSEKDACVFLNIMLALWCANTTNCLSSHNQAQTYDPQYSWTQLFAVNMLYIYNHSTGANPLTWLQFYDRRFFATYTQPTWNDDEDPVDDLDDVNVTIVYGLIPLRNRPFITPPKIAKEMIIFSLVLAGVIVAATFATGYVIKRAWKKHCLYQSSIRRARLSNSKDSFNQAVADYSAGTITEAQLKTSFNSFYKSTRKYNLWARLHGMARYDMINDFDLDTSGVASTGLFGSNYTNSDGLSALKKLITG